MLNGVMVSTNVFGTFSLGSSPGSTTKRILGVIYVYTIKYHKNNIWRLRKEIS